MSNRSRSFKARGFAPDLVEKARLIAAGYRIGAATLAVGAVVVWRYLPARAEAATLVSAGAATEAAV